MRGDGEEGNEGRRGTRRHLYTGEACSFYGSSIGLTIFKNNPVFR